MQVIENNLFNQVSAEESAIVSGGAPTLSFNLENYLFIVGVGTVFGSPGLTATELQYAFEQSITV